MSDFSLHAFATNIYKGVLPDMKIWALMPGAILTGSFLSSEHAKIYREEHDQPESPGDLLMNMQRAEQKLAEVEFTPRSVIQDFVPLFDVRLLLTDGQELRIPELMLNLDLVLAWHPVLEP